MEILLSALFGFIGGLMRACIGLIKMHMPKKKAKFRLMYLVLSLLASGAIGLLAGLVVATPVMYLLPLLAGYAGTDFIENLYKIRMKKF